MKKVIISLVATVSFLSVEAINPKLLEGTHTVVSPNYSPVMGLSFWEWGLAEQLYKFSPKFQQKQFSEVMKKIPKSELASLAIASVSKEINARQNSATENLVMELYSVVQGALKVTNAPDNPVRQLKPSNMGEILKIIQNGMSLLEDVTALPENQAKEKAAIEVELLAIKEENNKVSGQISKIQVEVKKETDADKKSALSSQLEEFKAQIDGLKKQREVLGESLKFAGSKNPQDYVYGKIKTNLQTMLNGLGFKNDKSKRLKWGSFVDAVIGSLKESTGDGKLYVENTTQGLLLSYLLAKAETRDDLQDYFIALKGDKSFKLSPAEYSPEDIAHILAAKTDASNFEEFANLVSAYTYKEKYASVLPKVVQNSDVVFHGINFADCMDTAVRMLANIVTYKKELSQVGVAPEGLSLNVNVEKFYASSEACRSSLEVGNSSVHLAWAQVIENVPHCLYVQIGTGPNDVRDVTLGGTYGGVMPIDSVFTTAADGKVDIDGESYEPYQLKVGDKVYLLAQKKVGDKTYLLAPKDSGLVCCEMVPDSLNLVVALNYIFNLNLYENVHQLFEADFISSRFKEICTKFKWQVPDSVMVRIDENKEISIPVETDHGEFSINLSNWHGYISVKDGLKSAVVINMPMATKEPTIAAAITLGLTRLGATLPKELQKDVITLSLDQKSNLVVKMLGLSRRVRTLTDMEKSYVKTLILSIVLEPDSADDIVKIMNDFGLELKRIGIFDLTFELMQAHDVAYGSSASVEVLGVLVEDKLVTVEKALQLIGRGMRSEEVSIRNSSVRMIDLLINNKLITEGQVPQLLLLLEKRMVDSDIDVQDGSFYVISSLINNKLITEGQMPQLLLLLEKGMADSNVYIRNRSVKMIELLINSTLIMKSQVPLPQLLLLVEKGMADSDVSVRNSSVSMISILIDNKLITEGQMPQLLLLLEKGMASLDIGVRNSSVSMISILIDNKLITEGQVPQLLLLFEKGMASLDTDGRRKLVSMINLLIKNKLIQEDQIPRLLLLIEKGLADPVEGVRGDFISVIYLLITQKMITQSEVESLKNSAIASREVEILEKLKTDAPLFISGRKKENIAKPRKMLSKGQKQEMLARMNDLQNVDKQALLQKDERLAREHSAVRETDVRRGYYRARA